MYFVNFYKIAFNLLYCLPFLYFTAYKYVKQRLYQGFGSAFFFADPDPGKNLHADPGEGGGGKGKNEFFF